MSFRDLELKYSYDSAIDDIVKEFYIPTLSFCKNYDRIAGFFTSASFAISAKGIHSILEKEGKMRLLVSPKLDKEDVKVLNQNRELLEATVSRRMMKEMLLETDEVIKNHHLIMAWLLKKNYLNIKIALPKENDSFVDYENIEKSGLFHQKIGIIEDFDGNIITFSGSINETYSAWTKNIEEFKVFKSWENQQKVYCDSDINKFNLYWNNLIDNVEVTNIPEAFEKKLIDIAPNHIDPIIRKVKRREYHNYNIPLFSYQEEAKNNWINSNFKMLFEMATGTGKTRTAIACIHEFLNKRDTESKIVVISTPQPTLSLQWRSEVSSLMLPHELNLVCDGSNQWRKSLKNYVWKLSIGYNKNLIIYTTHDTSSSKDFIELIKNAQQNGVKLMFVGDEVHALGSKEYKKALLDEYEYRVGLSATPSRWFDEEGTNFLLSYFNNKVFEFGIDRALTEINPLTNKTFLCNYFYDIRLVSLNNSELEDYIELTKKISKNYFISKENEDDGLVQNLLLKRARIVKGASNKYPVLQNIINELKEDITNTIIFVDPDQMSTVKEILKSNRIKYSLYTQKQDTKKRLPEYNNKTEREYIIELFKSRIIDVLVAIRCLNEGIDIPTADKAILMSSTTNPREYIQRIGRVIRHNAAKETAKIYDLMVYVDEDDEYGKKIFRREYARVKYIAQYATNNSEAIQKILEKW